MTPPLDVDLHRVVQHPLAAGLAGALIGLRWAPGDCWLQRLANVAAGSLLAGYLGPAVSGLLGQSGASAQAAIGFGLGLFGLSLAGSIARAIADIKLADLISDLVKRRR